MTDSVTSNRPLRVLFLCTGNSARSQIAEAVLNQKAQGRLVAESAGTRPAAKVNDHAITTLRRFGIDWAGHAPRGIETVEKQDWDFVITVCDRAKESCPVFPGRPVMAHWGMPDPTLVEGSETEKQRAFDAALRLLSRRIDLMLALPMEKLERMALEQRVRAIGTQGAEAPVPSPAKE